MKYVELGGVHFELKGNLIYMKRICNETEREVLLRNRNMVLKGIYDTSSKSSYSGLFVGLFASMAVMFAGLVPIMNLGDDFGIFIWLWFIFSFTVPPILTQIVFRRLLLKKKVSNFLKTANLCVNGATIVSVDMVNGTIPYIEDDFYDNDGNPIIVDYPALSSELNMADVGKRMLVMYDSDSSFQLMKLNDELYRLIPNFSPDYPLKNEPKYYKRIPHPNANSISFCPHFLTEKEKEFFSNTYVGITQKSTNKVLIICGSIIFVCIMLFSALIGIADDCFLQGLLIGLLICLGLFGFIMLMRMIGRKNMKKTSDFEFVQEVLFYSNVIEQSGRTVSYYLNVYEWKNGVYEVVSYSYSAMPRGTKYGDVLYKLTNKKGKNLFIRKKDIESRG